VARFGEGADQARRRSLAVDLLRPVDPGRLRAAARDQANAVIDAAGGRPFDVMSRAARSVPGRVLAALLGRPGETGEDGGPDERVAARIGLLIQAYDATAGLIGNAVAAAARAPGRRAPGHEPATEPVEALVEALVERTLRADPPVLVTRRITPDGATVALDLTSGDLVGQLEFGWGPHACPGADHARALAEGVIEPLLARCRWTGAQIRYPPPPALRVPERLEVAPVA
jgi:cytochrome P450